MQGLIQDRSLLFSNKLQKRYLCLILWVMTNTCRPKIALVSVHRLAEHLHAMSTLKSRYKISNLALNSVHPSLVIYNKKSPDLWELLRMSRHQYTLCIQTNCNNKKWMEGNYFTKMYLQCSLRLEGHTVVLCISGTATASRSWLHLQMGFGLSPAPASSCSTRHTSKTQTVGNLCWSNT